METEGKTRKASQTKRRRKSASGIVADDKGHGELEALLAGHCRQAVAFLPRGVLGVATAIELLGVLPAAFRLGLPDVTDSGPRLFALLVGHGLLAAMPSPRVVPAALGLIAGVSPLLQPRSARQWTLWLGQMREPGSNIVAALRERTPTAQISLAPLTAATVRPLRAAALRADRDRLATELAVAAAERAQAREDADRAQARANDLARQLEIAAKTPRRETGDVVRSLLAAVRKAARIPDDDPRTLPVLLHDLLQQRLDHMVRAEKAEQGLHRVLNDLAGSAAKIAALEQEVTTLKTELEDQEIELWMSAAEISLRRSRMLRPDQSEVDAYRRAGAAEARRAQQQRRESGREK